MRKRVCLLLLCAPAVLLSGCVTSSLWDETAFHHFYQPAEPVNLQVFQTPRDWLIQYDEVNQKSRRISRRAYYLVENRLSTANQKRPRFIRPQQAPEYPGIPVHKPGSSDVFGPHAILSDDGRQFTLYAEPGSCLGTHTLPAYPAGGQRVMQVLLTPLAVAADVTMFGGFLVLVYYGDYDPY